LRLDAAGLEKHYFNPKKLTVYRLTKGDKYGKSLAAGDRTVKNYCYAQIILCLTVNSLSSKLLKNSISKSLKNEAKSELESNPYTEKARSEMIICPMLLEIKDIFQQQISLF